MIPKLIIFDADGTLRRCTVEGQPCPNDHDQWELLPNVRETLAGLTDKLFGIVSNQAGVAYNYLTDEMAYILLYDLSFAAFGKKVMIEFCPHAVDADCECRKPKPRMLERCMNMALVGRDETLYVGDMESDRQAAENAGCAFVWAKDFFHWDE